MHFIGSCIKFLILDGSDISGGCGIFGGGALLEEVHHWERPLKGYNSTTLPACSFWFGFAVEDFTSNPLLSGPAACCHTSTSIIHAQSRTTSPRKFFYQLPWLWYFNTATDRVTNTKKGTWGSQHVIHLCVTIRKTILKHVLNGFLSSFYAINLPCLSNMYLCYITGT